MFRLHQSRESRSRSVDSLDVLQEAQTNGQLPAQMLHTVHSLMDLTQCLKNLLFKIVKEHPSFSFTQRLRTGTIHTHYPRTKNSTKTLGVPPTLSQNPGEDEPACEKLAYETMAQYPSGRLSSEAVYRVLSQAPEVLPARARGTHTDASHQWFSGAYGHGPMVGVRNSTLRFPWTTAMACRYVREKLYENFGGPTHLSLEHKCFGGNRRHMSSHETNMHALIYFKGNKFVLQGK